MKVTKSLKAKWKDDATRVAGHSECLTKHQLSRIVGLAISTITDAITFGRIPEVTKMGSSRQAPVRIPLWSALEYIDSFQEECE